MTTGSYTANDRVHLAVNVTLMLGISVLAAWLCWVIVPLGVGWRLACSALAFACAWWLSSWFVPRVTGLAIERLLGGRA